MKKILLLAITVGVFFQILSACTKSKDDEPIEIVVAGAHSGDLAPYGIPTKRAVEIVFDGSDSVSVNYQDDECQANTAATVASNIIGTKAVAVIGHICSGATESALNVYEQTGISVISSSVTNPALTKSGKYRGFFFRTIAPDDAQGKKQAQFLINTLKVTSAAIIHDKGDYGKGLAEYAAEELKAGGVSVKLHEGITVGAADYSTIVNKIASLNVDAVVFGGYHPEASKLIIQLKRRGVNAAFISGDGIQSPTFTQLAGDASEGVYATGPKDNASNPLYKEAKQLHLKKYSEEPGGFFYEGYAAALVIKKTLQELQKNGKDISVKTVADYIADAKNSFDTSVGTISFDKNGDATGLGFSVYQVKNGKYVKIQ